MKALTALIVDRVLDRFPRLKFGVIEQGASWVPGWMRNMDSAHNAFYKNEERLQKMSLKPSEFVQRQVRVTPYPHEDAGWIIANSGDEVCLFSSDYPHVEGGRNPIKRFEASMAAAGTSERQKQRFYCDNFVDLMGAGLAPELRRSGMSSYTTLLTERTGPVLKITDQPARGPERAEPHPARGTRRRFLPRRRRRGGAGHHPGRRRQAFLGRPRSRQPAGDGGPEENAARARLQGRVPADLGALLREHHALARPAQPTIAQVQGYCIMGGMMIASACDIIIASDDAQFADRAVKWGGAHVQYFSMPWDFGPRKTKEYLFTGEFISAAEAERAGLVNRVVPRAKLEEETMGARPGHRRARSLCAEARQGVGQRDAGRPGLARGDGERLQELHADHPAPHRDGHLRAQGPRKAPKDRFAVLNKEDRPSARRGAGLAPAHLGIAHRQH